MQAPSTNLQTQNNNTTSVVKDNSSDNNNPSKSRQKHNQSNKNQNSEESSKYLQKLLQKHTDQAQYVQSFIGNKQQQFQQQILQGQFDIRERQWTVDDEDKRGSSQERQKHPKGINRKQLQEELQLIKDQLSNSQLKASKAVPEEERLAFLKKMQKQKKEWLKKKQQATKLQEELKAQRQRKQTEQKQKIQHQRKQKKKQEVEERIRMQQQHRKKKQQQYKNQENLLKQKMKQKTTADKMEQHYNLKQNQSLEERKKRLAEIRAFHKPIDKKQLDAHTEKFQLLHAQRLAAAANPSQPLKRSTVAFYKSIFYKKVKEQQKQFIDKQNQQELSKLKQARDKLKKFSQNIRTNYKPLIDEKKVEEMRFRSVNLKNRSMSSANQNKLNDSTNKIGLRYLEYSKMQVDHQKMLVSSQDKDQDQGKDKKLDYLQQMRQKNKNRGAQSANDLLEKLDKSNMTKEEKTKKIMQFTQNLERKARRKQELQKVGSTGIVDDELDGLYLQAIHAKLSLLDDI